MKFHPNSIQLHAEVEAAVKADALGVDVNVFERLTATRIEIEGAEGWGNIFEKYEI
jgi:hypothetical protein